MKNAWTEVYAPLIGRILMGGYFLWNGIEATLNFVDTASTIAAGGVPAPVSLAIIFVAIEVLGGIALVVGIKTRSTAVVLAIYAVATAFLYTNFSTEVGQTLFLQDMAIVGGLLYISAFGSGSWSTDWPYKK